MINYSKENLLNSILSTLNPTNSESKIFEDFILNKNLKEI